MKAEPVLTPAQLRKIALETIALAKFPVLASADHDQPRARPVSPVRTEEFLVWVASLRSSAKTSELERNPLVELCYFAPNHDQVRITGTAVVVMDSFEKRSIWDTNPLLRAYLGSVDNPEFMLYRINPHRVRYMREWSLNYHEVPLDPVE